jgi:hypothetical protein
VLSARNDNSENVQRSKPKRDVGEERESWSGPARPATIMPVALSYESPRKVRAAGHDMSDGRVIVFIAGSVALKVAVEARNALWHCIYRSEADRYPVVGKCESGSW